MGLFGKKYTEEELMEGVRNRDTKVLIFIYEQFFPSVTRFIRSNSGTLDDARDTFQEGMEIIWSGIQDGTYKEVNMAGFLYGVCKNKWLKKLDKRKRMDRNHKNWSYIQSDVDFLKFVTEDIPPQLFRIVRQKLEKLGDSCQKLLNGKYLSESTYYELAGSLGMSFDQVKLQLYRCRNYFMKELLADPRFIELFNDYYGSSE